MILSSCEFETARLRAVGWHRADLPPQQELSALLVEMLTPAVTRSLPDAWHGGYDIERARRWIGERDREGATLLVADRSTGEPVGLMILFESTSDNRTELRLGYLLTESAWGLGYGNELVGGIVAWCRSQPSIDAIAGGVEPGNPASARILTNNGFVAVDEPAGGEGDQLYRLRLRDHPEGTQAHSEGSQTH